MSAAELAEQCGRGSASGRAWVSVHGHVFDITEFTKIHPGGTSIRLAAGRSVDKRRAERERERESEGREDAATVLLDKRASDPYPRVCVCVCVCACTVE